MKGILKQLEKKDKRKVVVIRHGETALNKEDNIRGWLNIPLDPHGFEQAEKMGKELKDSGIDCLYVSDLTRTLQTALCVSRESGIPIVGTTKALRPLDVGEYTGKSAAVVHPLIMKHALEQPDVPFKGGESFDSFRCRFLIGLIAILNENPGKTIGIVTHHRNDRCLRGWVEAGCPDDLEISLEHFFQKGIAPGTCDVLELDSPLII